MKFWKSSLSLVNTLKSPLVRGNYGIGRCGLRLHLLWHGNLLCIISSVQSTEVRNEWKRELTGELLYSRTEVLILIKSDIDTLFFHISHCKAVCFKAIHCIKCYIKKRVTTWLECELQSSCKHIHIAIIKCFLKCCFLTPVIFVGLVLLLSGKCPAHIYI